MLIRFTAPTLVFDEPGELVTSVDIHRKLDGVSYDDEAFTDFLSGPSNETELALLLEHGGYLRFQFNETRGGLDTITEFRASRGLDDPEMALLTDYVRGQWSDGIGENWVSESFDRHGYTLQAESDELQVAQTEDGIQSSGNPAADLFRAVIAGDLAAVLGEIPLCTNINATVTGFSPLRWAITHEYTDIAIELAKHTDVTKRDVAGMSLLHAVALSGMSDEDATRIAAAIIEAGADVNVTDYCGSTATDFVNVREKPQLQSLLAAHRHPT